MQRQYKFKHWQKVISYFSIIVCWAICSGQGVLAVEVGKPAEDSLISSTDTFSYKIEGRSDPFVPFITEKSQAAKMNEILPVESQLTGMQLFEPGQLTLVAIAMVGNDDIAMVEDTTGKGYILRTGMEIGRRGIITSIEPNKVIIEETAFTRAGKKLTSDIVMLLKKEGEE